MPRVVSAGKVSADVVVIGGGLVGLTITLAAAERELSVTLIGEKRPGEASSAAAGMLAPSVETTFGPAHDFMIAARERYPSYLDFLVERSGIRVPLNRLGILQVALSPRGVKGLKKTAPRTSAWIDAKDLQQLEPALSHALGAVFNPDDGAVDNTILVEATEKAVSRCERVERIQESAVEIDGAADSAVVRVKSDRRFVARRVVVAAGAWAGEIRGAPFARAIKPARGQLVSYSINPLRHVCYGPHGYVVPRGDVTIGGSTMENVGFDTSTTEDGVAKVRAAAEEICPPLAAAEPLKAWAGLRPVTPDLLPMLGADPEIPSIIYACGHSRNGVLMAPLTGDIIADLVTGTPLSYDLSQFRPDRF